MIQIRRLGEHTLKNASAIADSEFTDSDIPPSLYFKASLLSGPPSIAGDDDRYTYMRYWTAYTLYSCANRRAIYGSIWLHCDCPKTSMHPMAYRCSTSNADTDAQASKRKNDEVSL